MKAGGRTLLKVSVVRVDSRNQGIASNLTLVLKTSIAVTRERCYVVTVSQKIL